MDLILDANILFSVLIKSGITEDIVFNQDLNLYVPEFIFTEFEKYKKLIAEKTERNEEDTNHLLEIFMKKIKTFSNEETMPYLERAKSICSDEKDVDYFALALKLKCPIWSNDKKLKEQNKIKIYSTSDLINEFEMKL